MNSTQTTTTTQGSSSILIETLNYEIRALFLIPIAYLLLYFTSGFVVRKTFKYADIEAENNNKKDTGTAIGKIENILILTFMLLEAYTALGVIFAAKSIVRKSDMDTGDTTYYLTGTLANFTYSVIIGVTLHISPLLVIQMV
jgi:hypothetical protein